MTIDLSTLEAGETIELDCGGKIVVGEFRFIRFPYDLNQQGICIKIGNTEISYLLDGKVYGSAARSPLDIIAIHKKPKPREILRDVFLVDGKDWANVTFSRPESKFAQLFQIHYRITFLPETGDLKWEVVK